MLKSPTAFQPIQGEKVFYLIPPTEENLTHYEQWVLSSSQSEVFFGDLVSKCYCCRVRQGNTLFIPSGGFVAVSLCVVECGVLCMYSLNLLG